MIVDFADVAYNNNKKKKYAIVVHAYNIRHIQGLTWHGAGLVFY